MTANICVTITFEIGAGTVTAIILWPAIKAHFDNYF